MNNLNHSQSLAARLFAVALLLVSASSVLGDVRYVDVNSTNATPPYTNWITAATNIQDAVDAAVPGDEIMVANGIYATGGRAVVGATTNRVAVDKPLSLRSVNGPQLTIINGGQSGRCVFLTNEASLSGFTLTNGTAQAGGGAYGGGTLNDCRLTGNRAFGSRGLLLDGTGGGACGCTLNNCTLSGNSAAGSEYLGSLTVGDGGGAYGCTLNNCTVSGNWAAYSANGGGDVEPGRGGGASSCTLNNCTVSDNSAGLGGGASGGMLNSCTVTANDAWNGGGASGATLNNSILTSNSAGDGGGALDCTLNNCRLTGNSAGGLGGGAAGGTLNNCALSGNSAAVSGGGASVYSGYDYTDGFPNYFLVPVTLNNCTLSGNTARRSGGGAFGGSLNNCIVHFNTADYGANCDSPSNLNYCCTTPLPTNGVGNISLDPQLADSSHLSATSPCRGAGNAAYASGTDIDGESWASPPSIGCDEYRAGALTGPLSVGIAASFTNVLMGFRVQLTALIEGRTTANSWDFGDGTTATNQPYTSHAWTRLGDYVVIFRAYNESQLGGISANVTVHVVTGVHHVAADSTNPVAPYASWATAATNIQDAIDATGPGATVWVTNGIYASGGRVVDGWMTNRVVVDKPLTLRSVNGPQFTIIQGSQVPGTTNGDAAIRCVYLANGARLYGFTLTHGATRSAGDYEREQSGGGLYCASTNAMVFNCLVTGNTSFLAGGGTQSGTLNNCTVTGNSVSVQSGSGGGGAFGSTLNNCTLCSNFAYFGGGASGGTLNNCTVTGNSAEEGGGAHGSTLNNCTLIGNSTTEEGGGAYECTLNNCTLIGNASAPGPYSAGGGAFYGTLNNCIVYFNTAPNGANYVANAPLALNYCCTTPQPTNGVGNITNAPLFVDQASGNLRLQSNSPCINAGLNALAPTGPDLDGNPRIAGGTVDIGAYEFQLPTSVISYAWLQQYALPTDGSADSADPDGDGMNNWQEWRCGTDPTNALSALRLLAPALLGSGVVVRWESVADRTYFLERSTTASSGFAPLATGIPGQPGTTTYTDTNAVGAGPWFYRVGVSAP